MISRESRHKTEEEEDADGRGSGGWPRILLRSVPAFFSNLLELELIS